MCPFCQKRCRVDKQNATERRFYVNVAEFKGRDTLPGDSSRFAPSGPNYEIKQYSHVTIPFRPAESE